MIRCYERPEGRDKGHGPNVHELSIAYNVLEQVVELARQNHASAVEEVELDVGALCQVFPESLETAFTMVCEGTVAQGAVLKILITVATMQCETCLGTFPIDGSHFACPTCHKARTKVVQGDEILLRSVSLTTDQGAQQA